MLIKSNNEFLIPTKSIIFLILFVLPPTVIIVLTFYCHTITSQDAALLVNAYGILAGVYYFFKRLEFDKVCLLIKHRREIFDQLRAEFLSYDNLVKELLRKTFTTDDSLSSHRNNIQFSAATITTMLEVCQKSGDISSSQIKIFVKLVSFVEQDNSFTCRLQNLGAINQDQYFMRYGYSLGPVREIIYSLIADSESMHLKI